MGRLRLECEAPPSEDVVELKRGAEVGFDALYSPLQYCYEL